MFFSYQVFRFISLDTFFVSAPTDNALIWRVSGSIKKLRFEQIQFPSFNRRVAMTFLLILRGGLSTSFGFGTTSYGFPKSVSHGQRKAL
jgi:hypothetical protein